jgi:DNA adenine methylase
MKTPITYWGGKQTLAPLIISNIPAHTTYVEPFLGGGAVFWAKPPSAVEVVNDLNREVVNFYRQAKSNFPALSERIAASPHSRAIYEDALAIYGSPHLFTDLDRAWAFYIATNQGRSGRIGSWGYGTISNAVEKKIANRRNDFSAEYAARLDRVQIECADALKIMRLRDRPTTFFYVDPPYHNADMGHYGGYTAADFSALLDLCAGMQGMFLLSSYPSDILEAATRQYGWHTVAVELYCPASGNKKKKVEVLTANYPISGA